MQKSAAQLSAPRPSAPEPTGYTCEERWRGRRSYSWNSKGSELGKLRHAPPGHTNRPVTAMAAPAIPATIPITGNKRLREMKYNELRTSAISSSPSPKS